MPNTGERPEIHPAFHFTVEIEGVEGAVFNECTLPSLEMETQEVKIGGINSGPMILAGPVKSGRLVLKRGYAKSSDLIKWYKTVAYSAQDDGRSVSVVVYDSSQEEILRMNFSDCFPAKWSGPTLKTADNSIAIETLELAYSEVTFE